MDITLAFFRHFPTFHVNFRRRGFLFLYFLASKHVFDVAPSCSTDGGRSEKEDEHVGARVTKIQPSSVDISIVSDVCTAFVIQLKHTRYGNHNNNV